MATPEKIDALVIATETKNSKELLYKGSPHPDPCRQEAGAAREGPKLALRNGS